MSKLNRVLQGRVAARAWRVGGAIAACALSWWPAIGAAAEVTGPYPSRPIRLLIPFPPGGGADSFARIITPRLSDAMGQQWVVDNRGGAAGNIASEIVANAAPDGYTVLLAFNTALTVNPNLYPKLPFNIERDLQPITLLGSALYVLVVHAATVPASSLKDFIALAKAKPGQLNYASAGVGSPLHLAAELFKARAEVNLVHVPYKGGGPAAAAVLAGEAQAIFGSLASTLPHVRTGRLRALAVTGIKRSTVVPELPTIAESGFPGFDVYSWYGLIVPGKTPKPVADRIYTEALKVVRLPEVVEGAGRQGLDIVTSGPAEFSAQIRRETETWGKLIRSVGIKAD